MDPTLDRVRSLSGYNYYWKDKKVSDRLQTGVIAQEVKELFPELVYTNPHTGYYSVNYEGFIPVLIESTKEVYGVCQMTQKQMESLKSSVEKHDRALASLENRTTILENENRKLKEENQQLKERLDRIEKILLQSK